MSLVVKIRAGNHIDATQRYIIKKRPLPISEERLRPLYIAYKVILLNKTYLINNIS